MRKTYDLQIIHKPKTDYRTGKCAPEDLPALRRYQGVTGYMRKGHTEAEAIALYDRPRGVCACGAEAKGKARVCYGCVLAKQRAKQAQYRAEKRHLKQRSCEFAGCDATFIGWRRRKFCDAHTKDGRAKKYVVKPRVPKPKRVRPDGRAKKSRVLPENWNEPAPVKAKDVLPPVVKIINPGVPVTLYPPLPGRWESMAGELADVDPVRARGIDGMRRGE